MVGLCLPRPASLKPYVDDAERNARAFADTIQCAAPCRNQRFKAEKITWKWQAGTAATATTPATLARVLVDVYFIPCK